MLTRHSGAANRLSPSAIADAALAWPPPVSEVMIRNFWVGSFDILLYVGAHGAFSSIRTRIADHAAQHPLCRSRLKRRSRFRRMRFLQLPFELLDLNEVFRVER